MQLQGDSNVLADCHGAEQGASGSALRINAWGALSAADAIVGDNEQGIKTVAGNPSAIGYVSIGAAQYAADNGVAIKLLPLGGVIASVENVANGSYPLARELNLLTSEKSSLAAQEFLQFASSSEAAQTIKSLYFVPIANQD